MEFSQILALIWFLVFFAFLLFLLIVLTIVAWIEKDKRDEFLNSLNEHERALIDEYDRMKKFGYDDLKRIKRSKK